jgi:hypothetical protein
MRTNVLSHVLSHVLTNPRQDPDNQTDNDQAHISQTVITNDQAHISQTVITNDQAHISQTVITNDQAYISQTVHHANVPTHHFKAVNDQARESKANHSETHDLFFVHFRSIRCYRRRHCNIEE